MSETKEKENGSDVIAVIKEHVKWLEKRCKALSVEVERARKLAMEFGMFEDCGDSYDASYENTKGRFEECVQIKNATEKWMKKLKHEKEEQDNSAGNSDD